MATISKAIVDKTLRDAIFFDIFSTDEGVGFDYNYNKINDRQYGTIITDANGEKRYCRIGVIVAELRDDMTAEQLMQSEIDTYQAKQNDKAEKAKKKAEKIAADKAKREAKKENENEV
jgi:hypothetical protein